MCVVIYTFYVHTHICATHFMYIHISVQHTYAWCAHKHTFILCTKTHTYVIYTNIHMLRAYKYLCIFFVQWSSIKSCIYAIDVYKICVCRHIHILCTYTYLCNTHIHVVHTNIHSHYARKHNVCYIHKYAHLMHRKISVKILRMTMFIHRILYVCNTHI